ncbi:MAG TPA: hypothetical protein VK737_00460 [Opitutales bacterium]|jgi:hypothetical protein|nr:hypothetical protein [Opitutales bacterium]
MSTPAAIETQQSTTQSMPSPWQNLLLDVRRSIRYHNHRRRWFDGLNSTSKFLIIISGGTVLAFPDPSQKMGIAARVFWVISAFLGSLDLVTGFSAKGREHYDLAREFTQLEQEMVKVGEGASTDDYAHLYNRRLEIEAKEPPVKRVLDIYCHNELALSIGCEKTELYDIGFFKQLLCDIVDISPEKIQKFKK